MTASDKLTIGPTLGDINRGIENKAPKRVLYEELSKIADKSRGKNDGVSQKVKEGLRKTAEEIHKL